MAQGRGVQEGLEHGHELGLLPRSGIDRDHHPFRELVCGRRSRRDQRGSSDAEGPHQRPGHLAVGREAQGQDHVGRAEVPHEIEQREPARHQQRVADPRLPRPRLERQAAVHVPRHHQPQRRVPPAHGGHGADRDVQSLGGGGQAGRAEHHRALGQTERAPRLRGGGQRIEGKGQVVRQMQHGAAGQHPGRGRGHVAREAHHTQAVLEDAVVQRKKRGKHLAAQAPRHLSGHEGAGLAVRPPHLAEVGGDVASLHGLPQHQVVQAPVVEEDDARLAQRRLVDVGMGRGVADVVHVEVRVGVRGRFGHEPHIRTARQVRQRLGHVIRDAGCGRRPRAPDREPHGIPSTEITAGSPSAGRSRGPS